MTKALHRHSLDAELPRRRERRRRVSHRRARQALSRRLVRRGGVVPGPQQRARARRDQVADRRARVRAHALLHERADGGARGRSRFRCARRAHESVVHVRRVRIGRSGAQDRAAVFHRDRAAAAAARDRAHAELSRHDGGRAVRRRQHRAPRGVRAAAAERDASHRAVFCVSRPARRTRAKRSTVSASRTSSKRKSSSSGRTASPRSSPRRWSARRSAACRRSRLFQAHPRDLRQVRRAADPRRSDVRHGTHRPPLRVRGRRHRARFHRARERT